MNCCCLEQGALCFGVVRWEREMVRVEKMAGRVPLLATSMNISKTQGSIPNELEKLIALTVLHLADNELSGLGVGEDARKILDLLSRCQHSLDNNPWVCPPVPVVEKGIDAMKRYYGELGKTQPVLIDLRKVVFIGHSGAGKTSLIKSIKAGEGRLALEEELESVGVSVQNHKFENGCEGETDVRLYDLAGKVEYYGLHQMFLTERALYVLVWDASRFLDKNKELENRLKEWLVTLQQRAPHSTVLLCATHKDKCVPSTLLAKSLAWFRRSRSIEAILADVEHSIKEHNEQSKSERSTSVESLKLEYGIQLISSSPTCYGENGLADLQDRLKKYGEGMQWLIPPSWRLAIVVLDAVRDGVEPVEAARRHMNHEDLHPVESTRKRSWIPLEELRLHWACVNNSPVINLPAKLRSDDPEFTLQSVMDMRERGGSLLKHPEVVFLDVEDFALSLAPILNHKTQRRNGGGACIFAGRRLEQPWQLSAEEKLVSKGILETRFAEFLWGNDFGALPHQTFDVLVKLGILLPLPLQSHTPGDHRFLSRAWRNTTSWRHVKEFLVLMRLPQNAPCETRARFDAFNKLRADWGVVTEWEFSLGRTPHGLVERLVASCHHIGNVVKNSCWRRGACFVAHNAAVDLAGGSFALSLQFTQSSTSNLRTGGTLVVKAFGNREGRAVWGALRFVISTAWSSFHDFPGLSWQARVMCPKHEGRILHFLAGVKDSKGRFPGDPIIRPGAIHHCRCQEEVASRLGTVLPPSSPLENVFEPESEGEQGHVSFDEDGEERFTAALDNAMNATTEKAPIVDETTKSGSWRTPEWVKEALVAGPSGAIVLCNSWAPIFKMAYHWRDGVYAEAVPLTLFAVVMAMIVVVCAVVAGIRKLRQKYRWWSTKHD